MARIALIVLLVLPFWSAPTPIVLLGPPLLCHEIDIGTAPSLPWKSGMYGGGPEPAFEREKVIPEALRILESSDDALVHMETLRRAYIYLQTAAPMTEINDLGERLKVSVLNASLPVSPTATPNARRETLAWFDLAYFVAIVNNNGNRDCDFMPASPCHRLLERAVGGAPKDAGLQFGVGIGQAVNWFPQGVKDKSEDEWRRSGWNHLHVAMNLAPDPQSPIARNLMSFFSTGYGPTEKPGTLESVRNRIAAETRPK